MTGERNNKKFLQYLEGGFCTDSIGPEVATKQIKKKHQDKMLQELDLKGVFNNMMPLAKATK